MVRLAISTCGVGLLAFTNVELAVAEASDSQQGGTGSQDSLVESLASSIVRRETESGLIVLRARDCLQIRSA